MRFHDSSGWILLLLLLLLWKGPAHVPAGATFDTSLLPNASRVNNITLSMGCPEFLSSFIAANVSNETAYRYFSVTKDTGYGYFALHFSKLWMPPGGSVMVRAVEGVTKPDTFFNVTDAYPSGELHGDVLTTALLTKELRIEFYRHASPSADDQINDRHCYGFVADWYYYVMVDDQHNTTSKTELVCAKDNTVEAVCLYDPADGDNNTLYRSTRPVARLRIARDGGDVACTGWLLGSEGHLLTNHHCISTQEHASATIVEFGAEGAVCTDDCRDWGDCPGTVEALSTELVYADEKLDYALLKLSKKLPKKYGYLQLRASSVPVGTEVYIPQHPRFYGKRVARLNDIGTFPAITSTTATDADECGAGYQYDGDTDVGSSGSPVIHGKDHSVVALHHCGRLCANTGIPSTDLIAHMNKNGVLPPDAEDKGNEQTGDRFPVYVPPATSAPRVLVSRFDFNGSIRQDAVSGAVTIDHFTFRLDDDDEIAFDVLSAEISDDGVFSDLNRDCRATYMDAVIFLFKSTSGKLVKYSDDDDNNEGFLDGSVSYRDPYLRTSLKKGTYRLAVTSLPATTEEAWAGTPLPRTRPKLFDCAKSSSVGSYRIQFFTSKDKVLLMDELPGAVDIAEGACKETTSCTV